jgi:UDP:flavonoid glycosyltransferase YjiC (YdhE family)
MTPRRIVPQIHESSDERSYAGAIRHQLDTLRSALDGLDVDVVATVGGQVDPASLGPFGPSIRVEQYVPQGFVLDKAGIVISHGGAGTVIGAATAGKVQLCVPIAADQWDNADALSAASAGIVLEPHERDVDTIRQSVHGLLTDVARHEHAELLRNAFAAMPRPAELVTTIEQLA